MEKIINLARQLKYNSLEYVDSEDIIDARICIQTNDNIFLYKKLDTKKNLCSDLKLEYNIQVYWASKSIESFYQGLKETIRFINDNEIETKKIYIEFIPEDFLEIMKNSGFEIASEFVDFWIEDLYSVNTQIKNSIKIRTLKDDEASIAGEVTRSCAGYSRGFTGETNELVKEWNDTENAHIFIAELNEKIVGVCFVKLYGFDSKKGTVLWLRELAVRPEYQSKGIGREMLAYALKWGIDNGAKRSFLACDAENLNAIKLYESFNYKRNEGRGQINMEFVI